MHFFRKASTDLVQQVEVISRLGDFFGNSSDIKEQVHRCFLLEAMCSFIITTYLLWACCALAERLQATEVMRARI